MQYPPSTDDPKTAPVLVIDGVPRGLLLDKDAKSKKSKSGKTDKKEGDESKDEDGKTTDKDKSKSKVSHRRTHQHGLKLTIFSRRLLEVPCQSHHEAQHRTRLEGPADRRVDRSHACCASVSNRRTSY